MILLMAVALIALGSYALLTLYLPVAMESKLRLRKTLFGIVTSLLVFAMTIGWCEISDKFYNGKKEFILTDETTKTSIFKDDTGEYFVLGINSTNLFQPTYRIYLNDKEAKDYLDSCTNLSSAVKNSSR